MASLMKTAAAAAAVSCLAFANGALALDFGPLSIMSSDAKAFAARLTVLNVSVAEAAALNPRLADAFVWRAKGIRMEPWMKTLRFKATEVVNGRALISVTGGAVPPGTHRLLVWVAGSFREYEVEGGKAAVVYPKSVGSQPTGKTVTTRRGDTLSELAAKYRYRGVWRNQMIVAMYRINQDAFIDSNMNRMKTGARLALPTLEQVLAVSRQEATSIVAAHELGFAQWKNHTGTGAVGIREIDGSAVSAARGDRLEIARTRESEAERREVEGRAAAAEEQKAKEVAEQNAKLRALVLEEKARASGQDGAAAAQAGAADGKGGMSAPTVAVSKESPVMQAIEDGAAKKGAKAGQAANAGKAAGAAKAGDAGNGTPAFVAKLVEALPPQMQEPARNYWWVLLLVLLLGGVYLWRRSKAEEERKQREAAEKKIVADVDKMLSGVSLDLEEPAQDNAARLASAEELAGNGHREEAVKLAQFVLENGTPEDQAKAAAFLNRIGA